MGSIPAEGQGSWAHLVHPVSAWTRLRLFPFLGGSIMVQGACEASGRSCGDGQSKSKHRETLPPPASLTQPLQPSAPACTHLCPLSAGFDSCCCTILPKGFSIASARTPSCSYSLSYSISVFASPRPRIQTRTYQPVRRHHEQLFDSVGSSDKHSHWSVAVSA